MYDLGSHLVDQAVVLFGLPDSISADTRIQRPDGKVDDSFEIVKGFKELKVTLKAGMLVRGELPRYILLGDKGSYIKYGNVIRLLELANESSKSRSIIEVKSKDGYVL